ncbi:DUF4365 domain-containing protein [Cellulophaga baltica]|uniref:DUF4365 domain-containing protein n=1 Tax=Cellulophaga baltica TaxID=76594 RepID=UPI0004054858|nr:DUF4365 domain-containing protein [Cellulophaga baltica]
MAFIDNPTVDDYSKNCEDSVLAVKTLLKQKNGFICRTVVPDFGIDEDVELNLFTEKTGKYDNASNKHFSLQLKSIDKDNKDKLITKNDVEYIKLQFETSRLGYILRRPPAYGIVIIYDVREELLYFDYCENIYFRLNDVHGNDKWKNSEKPLIYIPTKNILDKDSIADIYNFMIDRHKNAQLCNIANASKYDIPIFEDSIVQAEIDYHNPKTIEKCLLDYGWTLINSNDFILIQSMLGNLPYSKVMASSDLLLLSAVVNCEIGNFIDADYFLKKYELVNDSNIEKLEIKTFTSFKVDFAFGRLNSNDYLIRLENQKERVSGDFNKLLIEVNIIYFKLLVQTENKTFSSDIINDIEVLFSIIKDSNIDERKKHHLVNYHTFNFNFYATNLIIEKIGEFKIKESLNIDTPISERIENAKLILSITELSQKQSMSTWEYAEKFGDEYLKANSLYNLSHYFFTFRFNIALLDNQNGLVDAGIKSIYERNINYAFNAYDIFQKMARNKDAYNAIIMAYEITALFQLLYNHTILNELGEIEKQIKLIEKQLNLPEYESVVNSALNKKDKEIEDSKNSFDIHESDFDISADKILRALNLPKERKENIIADMKSQKYFYDNRQSENLELLQDLRHTQKNETYYETVPSHLIRCNKCGFQTIQNKDVKHLLSMFDYHKC